MHFVVHNCLNKARFAASAAAVYYSAVRLSHCENVDPYKVLGVSRGASEDEIRRAYKKAASKNHPDHGGDAEEFKKIAKAYAILSDKSKKETFDRYGTTTAGPQTGSMGGNDQDQLFDAFRLFEEFLGAGNLFGNEDPSFGMRRKPATRIVTLAVSLEELFKGGHFKVAVPRQVMCQTCHGAGGDRVTCNVCHGRGYTFEDRRFGNYLQRTQRVCHRCQGNGSSLSSRCHKCNGQGHILDNSHTIALNLPPGTEDGEKFLFSGQGSYDGNSTQDVIVLVQEKEHSELQRLGLDLLAAKRLSLLDAITGFCLDFPDIATTQRFTAIPDTNTLPVADGDVLIIPGLGMSDRHGRRGALYVRLIVDLPKRMPPMDPAERRALLARALGGDPDIPFTPHSSASSFFSDIFGGISASRKKKDDSTDTSTTSSKQYEVKRATDRDKDRLFQQRRVKSSTSRNDGGHPYYYWGG
mmetsp:Transcript_13138/g.19658  ORF Transcript_13138/g.19658 Transcript_13138/m.19658 type:complete len:467 (-) Transcript_13138:1704-3104(-)